MSPIPSITFRGLPAPEPGPIPAAAAALLSARDHGVTGFADAPRDRTLLPELIAAGERLRGAASELVVRGDVAAVEGALALAAAGGAGGIPVVRTATTADPAYLFVVKDPDEAGIDGAGSWAEYEAIRDRLAAESGAGWRDRVAIVADPARGPFFEEGARTGVPLFPFPLTVSAPESILTAAGLLAAVCAGADPVALLDDARDAQAVADAAEFDANPAQRLAAALAAADGWAPPTAGPESWAGLASWLGGLLRHHSGSGPVAGGVTIHLAPPEPPESGLVVEGGATGAVVQVLLTGVDLAARAGAADA